MGKVEGLIWLLGVLAVLQVKLWNSRGAFHHLSFMGNYYKHVLTISAQQKSSPSRKRWRGARSIFELVGIVYGVNQKK